VKSLAFSLDTSIEISLLASISSNENGGGNITLWDLNKQKVHAIVPNAHRGKPITHISFINNEPILVSSSEDDNSLKMWFFEKGVIIPRLLKERAGHSEAP
jgi:WD40 repeat protein